MFKEISGGKDEQKHDGGKNPGKDDLKLIPRPSHRSDPASAPTASFVGLTPTFSLSGWRRAITENLRHLVGPSGGLSYHFSALRFRHLWTPFVKRVQIWMSEWNPSEKKLLLFGSSAGWSLPEEFLNRFELITVVEPDPLARLLLRLRFSKVRRFRMISTCDLLPWLTEEPLRFKKFLEDHPDTAILFSNLLGQVPLVWPRPLTESERSEKDFEFLEALKGRSWASYHDLLSAHIKPSLEVDAVERLLEPTNLQSRPQAKPALAEIAKKIWGSSENEIEPVVDHGTDWLNASAYGLWHLRPKTYHLIAFTQNRSEKTKP